MTTFEEQISQYNNWTLEYCNKVIFEYERFMILRCNNINTGPSDDINKLWQYHILNTEIYSNYCMIKFNKIIHHNPLDNNDLISKKNKLFTSLNAYKSTFGEFKYQEVWSSNIIVNVIEMELLYKNMNIV